MRHFVTREGPTLWEVHCLCGFRAQAQLDSDLAEFLRPEQWPEVESEIAMELQGKFNEHECPQEKR